MIESHLLKHLTGYIDGQWTPTEPQDTFDVYNPASGEKLAAVSRLGAAETRDAIAAGKRALATTPDMGQRREWLTGIHDALLDEAREIGRILCMEHGKPWNEAQGEVTYAANFFKDCAENLHVLEPRTLEAQPKNYSWTVHFRPIGVAGLIVPWNFPIGMIAKKLSAAIAGGCPSVIKPASETPLTMIAMFQLLDERIDLPAGMVNLVMGSASEIGAELCASPDVPMLSFTGSTEIGKQLIDQTKDQVKKLGLELGGNAPFIVFDDADLDAAADNLIANKFRGGGQTCVCANRVYVQAGVYDAFTAKVVDKVNSLRVGDGMSEDVDIGPLINKQGFEKVRRHVADALAKGAELMAGKNPDDLDPEHGLFYPPTVITKVNHNMACCQDETFGPLVPMIRFEQEDEAVELANTTEYGLAAYVFTQDDDIAARVIPQLRFGHCGYNTGTGPTPEAPFGGMKQSGIGREGGPEGLMEYVEPQTVPRGA